MQLSIHTYTRAIGIHNTKGQQDRHGGTSPGARMTKKESQRKKATETGKKTVSLIAVLSGQIFFVRARTT